MFVPEPQIIEQHIFLCEQRFIFSKQNIIVSKLNSDHYIYNK